MAAGKRSTPAPGVERFDFVLGYHLDGTKEALLAAGLAHADWFVDGSERDSRGRTRRTKRGEFEGKRFKCVHRAQTNDYHLTFYYVGTEREQREHGWNERNAERRHLEEAQADEARRVADLPGSIEEYRLRMLATADLVAREVRVLASRGAGGYRYDDVAMAEVEQALSMLTSTLELGQVMFSPQRRQATVTALRAKTAKANLPLQVWIATATASGQAG